MGANMDPADRRWFEISDDRWLALLEVLSRPATVRPALAELLAEPSPFEGDES